MKGDLHPRVSREDIDGESIVILEEPATGSTVQVVPPIGSNICHFQTDIAGRTVEVLASPPDMTTLRKLPTRWGSGVLFPYPGRVRNDSFEFRGEMVHLLPDPATGNAMHGVVRRREWRIVDMGATPSQGAWVQTALSSRLDQIPVEEWPYAFSISLRIQLLGGRLRTEVDVRNEGDKPMPFGLGFHPYFPTPFGSTGQLEQCEVEIPADEQWTDLLEQQAIVTPIHADDWPRRPLPIKEIEVSLKTERGVIRNHWFRFCDKENSLPRLLGRVVDPENRLEASILASPEFKTAIFYTPPGLPTASIEPHTCIPNAFNLTAAGQPDPGLEVVEPGNSWCAWYEIAASALDVKTS